MKYCIHGEKIGECIKNSHCPPMPEEVEGTKESTHKWTTIGEDTGPGYVVWCEDCGATGRSESSIEGVVTEIVYPRFHASECEDEEDDGPVHDRGY